jgi:hypothetical protein
MTRLRPKTARVPVAARWVSPSPSGRGIKGEGERSASRAVLDLSGCATASRRSPLPRPSPAGRGGIIRRLNEFRESAVAEWLSANQASADCCLPLPAGEGLRVRENRTSIHRVRIAERGERRTFSASPLLSPAGRGRIARLDSTIHSALWLRKQPRWVHPRLNCALKIGCFQRNLPPPFPK